MDFDNKEINSPFRYAGGKFYARKLILELLPKHRYYVEPFAGGASVFFAKNKITGNWLNDIDEKLINCLTVIQKQPEALIKRLSGEGASKERHTYYKKQYKPKTNLSRAVRWFYLNRTSYSGIMKDQNCFWGYGDKYSMRPEYWPRNILRTSQKLHGVKLTSIDFKKVIDEVPNDTFLFIDPPYFNADQDKFYTHSFARDDHFRLRDALLANSDRIKFLLTYDNSQEIHDLYDWCESRLEKEWNYTINRTDDQKNGTKRKGSRYKGRELFILNYDPLEAQIQKPSPLSEIVSV